MKLILKKEVRGLGRVGDIKEVNDGYARNFLLPQGLAEAATNDSVRAVKAEKTRLAKTAEKTKQKKIKLAKTIGRQKVVIKAKADDNGTLYAGLDKKSLAAELAGQGFAILPEEIILSEKIKKTGDYSVELNLGGRRVKLKLTVSGI